MSSSRTKGSSDAEQAQTGNGGVSSEGDGGGPLVDVTMPQMGVSVAEGTVVAWRVEVGDQIEADQTICEISTDKIDTEVPAPASGVVTEILVPVDTTVGVGEVLARIATGSAAAAAGDGQAGAGGGAAEQPTPGVASDQGGDGQAGVGGGIAEQPTPGVAGDRGGDGGAEATAPAREAAPSGALSGAEGDGHGERRRYSPVVQRIASEHGIDLAQIPGTGRGGRVRKQDVLAFIESGEL